MPSEILWEYNLNYFEKGYEFAAKNSAGFVGANIGNQYVNNVAEEIEKLTSNMNSFQGFSTASDKLKGDIAEFWHSGTFNIDAAVKNSSIRTSVDRSHGLGSADVISNSGQSYGMKYYSSGAASAKQQAKSIYERFQEYKGQGGSKSIDEFLQSNNISGNINLGESLYSGQVRIIPSDQLADAIKYLEQKIAKESVLRPEQAERYTETLNMLKSKIQEGGVGSKELTNNEARLLADTAKEGAFDPADHGLTTENLLGFEEILNSSFKAGMTAATISMVLQLAPEIYKSIDYLIKNGAVEEGQFKRIGLAALDGGAQGFLRGSISAALTSTCKAGHLGSSMTSVNPAAIGASTVLVLNTIQSAIMVVAGKKTSGEAIEELVEQLIMTTGALIGGTIGQSMVGGLPVIGYLLGSLVGSVVGNVVYNGAYSSMLSFCVESGFTCFGLVDQDYTLPEEVLREIGIEIFEYEKFEYEKFEYEAFEYEKFEYEKFEYETIGITCLRRGVIGVRTVGYC